jgi:hypothetical protein
MNRFVAASVLAVLAGGITAPARAQQFNTLNPLPTRAPTPGLSPYLNLTNTGNNNIPAVNYYLGTVPEQQRRQFQQNAGAAIYNLERLYQTPTLGVNDLLQTLPNTGHVAVFNNTGGYFNSPTGSTRPVTTPQAAAPAPKR